jgi:endonuclease YncB( thermonuclease family)
VLLPDGTTVNHKLVKDGWCWWYRKYAAEDTVLEGLENEARQGRKGLWVEPNHVPPWEWTNILLFSPSRSQVTPEIKNPAAFGHG